MYIYILLGTLVFIYVVSDVFVCNFYFLYKCLFFDAFGLDTGQEKKGSEKNGKVIILL